jgi:histidinol phosphatase-like enzyme
MEKCLRKLIFLKRDGIYNIDPSEEAKEQKIFILEIFAVENSGLPDGLFSNQKFQFG